MKHTMVWFGQYDAWHFHYWGDENPIVIVNSIDEKAIMNPDDVEEYCISQGYDSWLVLDEFEGEVVFSQTFLKGLINE
jgi:hypothetical protein